MSVRNLIECTLTVVAVAVLVLVGWQTVANHTATEKLTANVTNLADVVKDLQDASKGSATAKDVEEIRATVEHEIPTKLAKINIELKNMNQRLVEGATTAAPPTTPVFISTDSATSDGSAMAPSSTASATSGSAATVPGGSAPITKPSDPATAPISTAASTTPRSAVTASGGTAPITAPSGPATAPNGSTVSANRALASRVAKIEREVKGIVDRAEDRRN